MSYEPTWCACTETSSHTQSCLPRCLLFPFAYYKHIASLFRGDDSHRIGRIHNDIITWKPTSLESKRWIHGDEMLNSGILPRCSFMAYLSRLILTIQMYMINCYYKQNQEILHMWYTRYAIRLVPKFLKRDAYLWKGHRLSVLKCCDTYMCIEGGINKIVAWSLSCLFFYLDQVT